MKIKAIFFKCCFIIFLCVLMNSCTKNDVIKIVNVGKSNYEIVLNNEASEDEEFAVKELQNYLKKIASVELAIVDVSSQSNSKNKIFVKKETFDKNKIVIKVEGDNLIISGGSGDALKNAVYEFLERYLDCKWYAPNVEEIPTSKAIVLKRNINFEYTPEITTRTVHSRLFYENSGFAGKHKVTTEAFPRYVPKGRVHTFNKFIPEEKFYKKHPEYFALRGSKRLPTQLCLTNNNVLEIVKDSVKALFNRYPKSDVISVSSNDNTQYCECSNCKKIDEEEESHSATMIRFVNKVADAFPEKTISTLAYQYTRKPCKTIPKKNVLITLCSIECDRSGAIEEKCKDFAKDIEGWNALGANLRIWDYTTQFTNFLAPFPNLHTLKPNINFFKNNHAKWVFEQHSNNPSELFELRSYIMAKLLWNPDLNLNDLVLEFTNGYYEEAGTFVKKYIDLVHEKIKEDEDFFLFLYGDPSQAFASYLSPELLTEYNHFFDAAEKAVQSKKEILKRVKEARLSIDYATLEACKKNLSENFVMTKQNKEGEKIKNPFVVQKLEDFMATSQNANITMMNEMRFSVKEYYSNYKKALEVATQPNKAIGKKVTLLTKPKKYANEDPQVLTDGALGGNSFYANWLGFEGNSMEVIIDLENKETINSISTAFLQVSNHVVFFPLNVRYYISNDNKNFKSLGVIKNDKPLVKKSKINDIKYFNLKFSAVKARYIKVKAENMNTPPYWHHAAGQPSWIFADEIIIN